MRPGRWCQVLPLEEDGLRAIGRNLEVVIHTLQDVCFAVVGFVELQDGDVDLVRLYETFNSLHFGWLPFMEGDKDGAV